MRDGHLVDRVNFSTTAWASLAKRTSWQWPAFVRPLGFAFLGILLADVASAQQPVVPEGSAAMGGHLTPGQIWTFLFVLVGPIKIIAPFAAMTRGADGDFVSHLAWRGAAFAAAVLVIAAFVGGRMLENFNIHPAVLTLAGGLVLFLVALRATLDQIAGQPTNPVPKTEELTLRLAFSPLAFPVIVTPAGVAAVIVFTVLAPDAETKLVIAGLLALILVLDLCAMLFARVILRWAAMPLQVFGAVLGIIQLALGLHVILFALHTLGTIVYNSK